MDNKNKFGLLILIAILLILPVMAVQEESLGDFKRNNTIILSQVCDTCTYVNIDSIFYPNGTVINIDEAMIKTAQTFTYEFNDTNKLGQYSYYVCGDKDGNLKCERISFTISRGGSWSNTSEWLGMFIMWLLLFPALFILSIKLWKKPFMSFVMDVLFILNAVIGIYVLDSPLIWIPFGIGVLRLLYSIIKFLDSDKNN